MPKKKAVRKIAGVAVVSKPRAKKLSSAVFKPGNPHRFVKGVSGNPEGCKPRTSDHLLSKSLRVALADRAPDNVCEALGLSHASWSQCLARKLIYMAIKGDMQALTEIRTCTEGARISADLSFPDPAAVPPLISLCFVESNGNGKPLYDTPDGMPLALPAEVSD